MLQKSKSKTIAKAKYIILLPLIMLMLTYVACSDDANPEAETSSVISDEASTLKATLYDEILEMEKNGASFQEISEVFFIERDVPVKSREAYYRMQAFMRFIEEKNVEREKAAGTYDENKKNPFQSVLDQDYEEYVAYKQNITQVKQNYVTSDNKESVPFAVIDQVPVFPGCENLSSNEEQKKCMSEKIQEYVNKNFNTGLGKELNLSGTNRIIVQFKIDKQGNIKEVKSRAPHPDLEVEAERVINSLPSMKPGKQGGVEVGVVYSLPIVFQVGE